MRIRKVREILRNIVAAAIAMGNPGLHQQAFVDQIDDPHPFGCARFGKINNCDHRTGLRNLVYSF